MLLAEAPLQIQKPHSYVAASSALLKRPSLEHPSNVLTPIKHPPNAMSFGSLRPQ
jgi:hypothetical protein